MTAEAEGNKVSRRKFLLGTLNAAAFVVAAPFLEAGERLKLPPFSDLEALCNPGDFVAFLTHKMIHEIKENVGPDGYEFLGMFSTEPFTSSSTRSLKKINVRPNVEESLKNRADLDKVFKNKEDGGMGFGRLAYAVLMEFKNAQLKDRNFSSYSPLWSLAVLNDLINTVDIDRDSNISKQGLYKAVILLLDLIQPLVTADTYPAQKELYRARGDEKLTAPNGFLDKVKALKKPGITKLIEEIHTVFRQAPYRVDDLKVISGGTGFAKYDPDTDPNIKAVVVDRYFQNVLNAYKNNPEALLILLHELVLHPVDPDQHINLDFNAYHPLDMLRLVDRDVRLLADFYEGLDGLEPQDAKELFKNNPFTLAAAIDRNVVYPGINQILYQEFLTSILDFRHFMATKEGTAIAKQVGLEKFFDQGFTSLETLIIWRKANNYNGYLGIWPPNGEVFSKDVLLYFYAVRRIMRLLPDVNLLSFYVDLSERVDKAVTHMGVGPWGIYEISEPKVSLATLPSQQLEVLLATAKKAGCNPKVLALDEQFGQNLVEVMRAKAVLLGAEVPAGVDPNQAFVDFKNRLMGE